MKRLTVLLLVLLGVLGAASASHAQLGLRVGGGIHYLRTIGDIKDDATFDENAINFLASVQLGAGLVKFEGDLEWVPDYGGSDESLWQPQAFVLVGNLIYGGGGIGWGYIDGEWFDEPFYALRVGVDFPLGGIHLDVNANYRFQSTKVFESVDTEDLDSITFGAIVRFGL